MNKKDMNAAIHSLCEALTVQDGLHYNKPANWFFPVRESLGAALLKSGDASGAEKRQFEASWKGRSSALKLDDLV